MVWIFIYGGVVCGAGGGRSSTQSGWPVMNYTEADDQQALGALDEYYTMTMEECLAKIEREAEEKRALEARFAPTINTTREDESHVED